MCRCGACSSASSLTLKFVAHFGAIQEIKVASFLKATGADMIVAHRLLKNEIEKHEYLLLSRPYLRSAGSGGDAFHWQSGCEEYSSIGKVEHEYAHLDHLRKNLSVPDPPAPEPVPEPAPAAREISIEVDVPMLFAYQNLVDTDKRNIWVKGMTKMERQPAPERAGSTHYCLTEGIGLDHTIVAADFGETEMTFIEKVTIRNWRMVVYDHYKVESLGPQRSRLSLRFAFRRNNLITKLVERVTLKAVAKDFLVFKQMCEEGLAS